MREITVAATQMACTWDVDANVARAMDLVRDAAGQGADVLAERPGRGPTSS